MKGQIDYNEKQGQLSDMTSREFRQLTGQLMEWLAVVPGRAVRFSMPPGEDVLLNTLGIGDSMTPLGVWVRDGAMLLASPRIQVFDGQVLWFMGQKILSARIVGEISCGRFGAIRRMWRVTWTRRSA